MKSPKLTEKAIQTAVLSHWKAFGVPGSYIAAIPNAGALGQPGLTRGLFDLLVMAPAFGVAFLELKTENGSLSKYQEAFADALYCAGVKHAVCRGRDEPIRQLEEWGIVRKAAA